MRTPEEFKKRVNQSNQPALSDAEIERIADERIDLAYDGQPIVYVSFDDAASARRCAELYSKHWPCSVDGRGFTVEISLPISRSR